MTSTVNKRITYLTAGAAGMYCGSCMHDNSLARALTQSGWETLLVPTYTPIRTDETDVAVDQVFFGGINVYLQQKIPLFRHLPKMLDHFLDNPRLIRRVTSRAIETDPKMLGSLAVSMLRGSSGNQRKEVKRLIHWLGHEARSDYLILSNILIGGFIPDLKRQLQIPVVVTLQGDDIFLESLKDPHKSDALELIRQLDDHIDAYLVHSCFYADAMSRYLELSRDKMHITPLGIDTGDFADWPEDVSSNGRTPTIGYLARLTPDKGLHRLVDAFIQLKQRPGMDRVRLKIAGWLGSDHTAFAREQFAKLDSAGLGDQYEHVGSVTRKQKLELLRSIDLLCVPTEYREPKGLYVLEALAAGVPFVQPDHGVFPELFRDLGGGVLFDSDSISDLVEQLFLLINDNARRASLGQQGRQQVLRTRDSHAMAQATIDVLNSM